MLDALYKTKLNDSKLLAIFDVFVDKCDQQTSVVDIKIGTSIRYPGSIRMRYKCNWDDFEIVVYNNMPKLQSSSAPVPLGGR